MRRGRVTVGSVAFLLLVPHPKKRAQRLHRTIAFAARTRPGSSTELTNDSHIVFETLRLLLLLDGQARSK